jgi:tape measure domain-containing protein
MSGKTRFTVELLDKVSKPSRQIGRSLDAIGSRGPALQKSVGASFSGIGVAGVAMGNFIAEGAARAVGALADLGAAAVGTIAEYTKFAQNSELAFNSLAKHGASGARLFEHARNLAVEFGMDVRDTSDNFKKLLSAQFNPRLATDIVKMGADLRSIGASADDMKGAVRAISQIKGTGILQGDELNQLAEAQVSIDLIRQNIGKLMGGKSVAEVLKLQEAGKIDADTAIQGILNAVKEKTGSKELGAAGKRFADRTLEGMAGRLKAQGQSLMVDLGSRLAPAVERFAAPLGAKLSTFLASPKVQAGIDRVVAGLEKGFGFVAIALEKSAPLVQRFVGGFIDKIGPALPNIAANAKGFLDALDRPELAAAMGRWGERLAVVGGMILQIGGYVLRVIPSLIRIGDTLNLQADKAREGFAWLIDKATTWGPAIIDGLAKGLEAGVAKISAAAGKVARAVTDKLQSVFHFGSPSKFMEQRGEWISEGLQIGMDRVKPVPDWLSRDPTNDFGPRASSFGPMPPIAASGGAGPIGPFHIQIDVNGAGEPMAVAEAVGDHVRREVEDLFDELALAAGA